MKKTLSVLFVIMLATSMLLSACGGSAPAPAAEEPAAEAPAATEAPVAADGQIIPMIEGVSPLDITTGDAGNLANGQIALLADVLDLDFAEGYMMPEGAELPYSTFLEYYQGYAKGLNYTEDSGLVPAILIETFANDKFTAFRSESGYVIVVYFGLGANDNVILVFVYYGQLK